MKKNKNINPEEIIEKLKSNELEKVIDAVREGDFSKEDIAEISKDFDDLILEAYKTKFSLEIGFLLEEQPDLSVRDVVVKMLKMLPEDVEESHILILTNFIIEKWKSIPQKLAA